METNSVLWKLVSPVFRRRSVDDIRSAGNDGVSGEWQKFDALDRTRGILLFNLLTGLTFKQVMRVGIPACFKRQVKNVDKSDLLRFSPSANSSLIMNFYCRQECARLYSTSTIETHPDKR